MGDLIFNGGGPKRVSFHHALTSAKASMGCGLGTSSQCMITSAISPPSYEPLFRFTVRNITVNNAQSAVFMDWNWGNTPPFYRIRGSNSY